MHLGSISVLRRIIAESHSGRPSMVAVNGNFWGLRGLDETLAESTEVPLDYPADLSFDKKNEGYTGLVP